MILKNRLIYFRTWETSSRKHSARIKMIWNRSMLLLTYEGCLFDKIPYLMLEISITDLVRHNLYQKFQYLPQCLRNISEQYTDKLHLSPLVTDTLLFRHRFSPLRASSSNPPRSINSHRRETNWEIHNCVQDKK